MTFYGFNQSHFTSNIYIYVVQHRLVKLDTIKKLSLLLLSKHNKNHKYKTHE